MQSFDLQFERPVTILIGENGSGKSTVIEAIAELSGLPVGGGGRNELADLKAPHDRSELAPFLRAAFQKKPKNGYFFRRSFRLTSRPSWRSERRIPISRGIPTPDTEAVPCTRGPTARRSCRCFRRGWPPA